MNSAVVPSFFLYGEPHRAVAEGFIHVEELGDRSRPSEWTIRPHAHADLVQLFLIDAGGGAMQVEERVLSFVAPAVLTVPAGVVHGFIWTSESAGAVVTLACSFLQALVARHADLAPVFASAHALPAPPDSAVAIRSAVAQLKRELSWSVDGHDAAVEAALLSMMVDALRMMPPESEHGSVEPGQAAALVARFRARIEQRFRLRESVTDYAAALGTSETRLRAACLRIAGRAPAAMLDQRAMLEARRALIYSPMSVAEVGYSIGINDPAYFSRFFSRRAGCSPRRYRQDRQRPGRQAVS